MQVKKLLEKFKIRIGKVTAIMLAVFAVLLAADLILKWCEVKYNWNFTVIPYLIEVVSGSKNTGAAFSFLGDKTWGITFLTILSCFLFVAVALFFLLLPERFVVLKLSLAMIGAGAVGNIVDRIALGYVRDFVVMNIFGVEASCNFADFWIVLGVILAAVDVLFLNEWAVLPLTKAAKARVAAREKAEEEKEANQSENKESDTEQEQSVTDNQVGQALQSEDGTDKGET